MALGDIFLYICPAPAFKRHSRPSQSGPGRNLRFLYWSWVRCSSGVECDVFSCLNLPGPAKLDPRLFDWLGRASFDTIILGLSHSFCSTRRVMCLACKLSRYFYVYLARPGLECSHVSSDWAGPDSLDTCFASVQMFYSPGNMPGLGTGSWI